jgi:hypothetical protein
LIYLDTSVLTPFYWTEDRAIPGHPCSQAGKTFTVEMDSGKQM